MANPDKRNTVHPISFGGDIKFIAVSELNFDRSNPRLAEYGITQTTKDVEIVHLLWEAMDVMELVQSIAASGYFKHEPVIAAKENDKLVVIEGNRRLAAVRVLRDPDLARTLEASIPTLPKNRRDALEKIPVIVESRRESWRYLGFKHVNGPAKWSAFAKAKYIADVHKQYEVSLKDIANQIGDRHNTVQRLFRGFMVLEQARISGVYDPDERSTSRLAFSHLYTALGYEGFCSFLGIKTSGSADAESPIPAKHLGKLREVLVWLYGNRREKVASVINSQNPDLRYLDAVLASKEAVAALRKDRDLVKAYEISRPPESLFEEALLSAKRNLTTARAYLTTGYDRTKELLRIAGDIANLADDVYREMTRKAHPDNETRLTTER